MATVLADMYRAFRAVQRTDHQRMLFENYVGGATHHASRRTFVGAKCDQDVRDWAASFCTIGGLFWAVMCSETDGGRL